jgi:hypothetical protein
MHAGNTLDVSGGKQHTLKAPEDSSLLMSIPSIASNLIFNDDAR